MIIAASSRSSALSPYDGSGFSSLSRRGAPACGRDDLAHTPTHTRTSFQRSPPRHHPSSPHHSCVSAGRSAAQQQQRVNGTAHRTTAGGAAKGTGTAEPATPMSTSSPSLRAELSVDDLAPAAAARGGRAPLWRRRRGATHGLLTDHDQLPTRSRVLGFCPACDARHRWRQTAGWHSTSTRAPAAAAATAAAITAITAAAATSARRALCARSSDGGRRARHALRPLNMTAPYAPARPPASSLLSFRASMGFFPKRDSKNSSKSCDRARHHPRDRWRCWIARAPTPLPARPARSRRGAPK